MTMHVNRDRGNKKLKVRRGRPKVREGSLVRDVSAGARRGTM
jgi:hypothetical protein